MAPENRPRHLPVQMDWAWLDPRTLLPSAPLPGDEGVDESPRVGIFVGTFRGTSGKLVLVFGGNQKDSDLSLITLFSLPNKLTLYNDSVQYK